MCSLIFSVFASPSPDRGSVEEDEQFQPGDPTSAVFFLCRYPLSFSEEVMDVFVLCLPLSKFVCSSDGRRHAEFPVSLAWILKVLGFHVGGSPYLAAEALDKIFDFVPFVSFRQPCIYTNKCVCT